MILDHSDAFNEIPLDERELNFCCADLGEQGLMMFYGMGFRGEVLPERVWPPGLHPVQTHSGHAFPPPP